MHIWHFMLSWAEHEKVLSWSSGPDLKIALAIHENDISQQLSFYSLYIQSKRTNLKIKHNMENKVYHMTSRLGVK